MNKLICVFILLSCFAMNAQRSTIEITDFRYFAKGDNKICGGNVEFRAHYSNGDIQIFDDESWNRQSGSDRKEYLIEDPFTLIKSDKILTKLSFYYRTVEYTGSCAGDNNTILSEELVYDLGQNSCIDGTVNYEDADGDRELVINLNFKYKISTGVDVLTPQDAAIGYDDSYTMKADAKYSGTSYNWQYQIVDNYDGQNSLNKFRWKNLSRPATPSELVFKASEHEPESVIGKDVVFRIKPCYDGDFQSVVKYDILNSAPHFEPLPEINDVGCFGGNDGSVKFKLDRELRDGESLGFNIVDLSRQIGTKEDGLTPLFFPVRPLDITSEDMDGLFLTINELGASKEEGFMAEFVGGGELYADGFTHESRFNIVQPSTVDFMVTDSTKVNCNGGADGTITIRAQGGHEQGKYRFQLLKKDSLDIYREEKTWTDFTNGNTHIISNLPTGHYKVKLMNKNGDNECLAKELAPNPDNNNQLEPTEEDIERTAYIGQPDKPLSVTFLPKTSNRAENSNRPKAHGFTDGLARALVTGGTAPYSLTWIKDGNTLGRRGVIESDDAITDKDYAANAVLDTIGTGTYTLIVTDANFDPTFEDKNKQSCTATDTIFIDQPEPLTLILKETNPISCHNDENNEFIDNSSDGKLTAIAGGGVPFEIKGSRTLPYTYIWKEEIAKDTFRLLENETDSVLTGVSDGRYSVNILDANNITIGTAVNNMITPEDVKYYIEQPDPIEINIVPTHIACYGGTEGTARVTVTGGNGDFKLQWSNGETTESIENLSAGKYSVLVIDKKGCEGRAVVRIIQPEPLKISVIRQKKPTCNNGGDGAIAIQVTGGEGMYTYQWADESLTNETPNTPSTLGMSSVNGNTIEGLVAGIYSVTVTDENQCKLTQEFTLTNPSPNLIDLGEDRLLCGGQPLLLDASFADEGTTYEWTSDNGFTSTSPIIEITEAGTYTVALTTPLGCSGGDSVIVTTSGTEIDAHFVVSTQAFAGEEVALINISSPLGDLVEWYFPPEAEVVVQTDEDVVLLFEEPGAYDIILRSNQGECYIDYMKSIIVEKASDIADIGDAENPFITEFKIYPNPSDGNFKVDVELTEASDISLKLFSMATQGLLNQREEGAGTEFSLDYGVALASGSYVLLLETAKASEIRKVLIK